MGLVQATLLASTSIPYARSGCAAVDLSHEAAFVSFHSALHVSCSLTPPVEGARAQRD